ncbi:MAG: HAD family hydrolase [Bacteroidales bacterium]|nr:HAD family hydrolase [Bacteroidales bacterium]
MPTKLAILDRDGVIDDNSQHYYVYRKEDFTFNPGVMEAIASLCRDGYRIAVVSNQSGIAKGLYTLQDIDQLHQWMAGEIEKNGGRIDKVYICPHHPNYSNCLCRKPNPLLLEKAMAEMGATRDNVFFVGDSDTDLQAGMHAGIRTYKVEKNGNLYNQLKELNIIKN